MTMTDTVFPGLPDPVRNPEHYDGVPLKRGLAWLVDFALVAVLSVIALPFTAFTGVFFFPALMMVIGFLYRWVTIATGSATLGMRLMNITFRNRYGEPFDSGTAFLHTAGYTASVLAFPAQLISIALMLISERKQGLTDHVLGTVAINR